MTITNGRLEQASTLTTRPDRDASMASGHPRVIVLAWFVGALTVVACGYALVAYRNPGFFLVDDIESAEFPVMAHLGSELRNGAWPWLTERNWTVGLVAGDPQYGIFNPLSLLVYWLVDPIGSLVRRIFVMVLIYVLMLSAGVFWAARSLGSTPPFAALASVAAGLNVYLLYWVAAGWTSLLPGMSWYVIAAAALLAALDRQDRPWRAVVAGVAVAMLLTAGAPFALLAYAVTAAMVLGAKYWGRRAQMLREARLLFCALTSGVVLGAVPWIVATYYISYTRRQSGWFNNGFLTFHLESVLMSFTPSVRPFTGTFQGWKYLDQPVAYGSWLFAGAAAILWTRGVRLRSTRLGVLLAGLALVVATVGPERLGPFRWPSRLIPFAMVLLVLVMVVILEKAAWSPIRQGRDRRPELVVVGVALTALSFMLNPNLVAPLVTAAVLFAGVPLVLWCARHRRRNVLALAGISSTLAVWVVIVIAHPETTDFIDLSGAGDLATAQQELSPLTGHRTLQLLEFIPVGDISQVLGNSYSLYATQAEVINGYTSLVPEALGALLCLKDTGYVCPDAPARIFQREPETGLRYVDLFGVSQIMVQKGPLLDRFEQARSPEWAPVAESDWWVMYRNGTALGEVPVVWMSEGGAVERVGTSGYRVSLPAGGRIVLSRPLWPGTTVSVGSVEAELDPVGDVFVGATFDEAVDGELSIGHVLPGRGPAAVAGVLGTAMLTACAVAAFISTRRRFQEVAASTR